jgi:signal transduction histidine kinase
MLWLSLSGAAVMLLALSAFFLLWRWMVQKKRLVESQKELAEQGKQLAEQKVKQLEQEKQLIAAQARPRGRSAGTHPPCPRSARPTGRYPVGLKIQSVGYEKDITPEPASQETYNKAMELLDESIREMRRVAHHLMPDTLSRFGLKRAVSE